MVLDDEGECGACRAVSAVPFLLAGGNPDWKPREPVLGIRKRLLMTTDEHSPYKRANRDRRTRTYKDPRSTPRSRRSIPPACPAEGGKAGPVAPKAR